MVTLWERPIIYGVLFLGLGSSGLMRAQVVQGTLDVVDNSLCRVAGWARDPQATDSIQIRIYRDGTPGSGVLVSTFAANQFRSDLPFADKNHGFDQTLGSNPLVADGNNHALYAYGVSLSGAAAPLNGNGKMIQCASLGSATSANVREYGAKGDGLTDDSNAIQAALDDTLPGGIVLIPSGTYMLGTPHFTLNYGSSINGVSSESFALRLSKKVILKGEGRTSILKLMPVRLGIGFFLADSFTVEKLVFDGNGSQRFKIDPSTGVSYNWPEGLIVSGLWLGSNANRGRKLFTDSEFRYGIEDGTGGLPAPDFTVENCYIHDNGGSVFFPPSGTHGGGVGISLDGGLNNQALDNTIIGNTHGIVAGFGPQDVSILNNIIVNQCGLGATLGSGAISIPGSGGGGSDSSAPGSGFTVQNNLVEGNGTCGYAGISIIGKQNGTLRNNQIINNQVIGLSFNDQVVSTIASTNWTVTDNLIGNTTLVRSQKVGILVADHSSGIRLANNVVTNNGQTVQAQIQLSQDVGVNADYLNANTISFTAPASNQPVPAITAAGIVNAASGTGGGISPGEILVIYGSNLGPVQLVSATANSNGRYERSLAGTRVLFDGVPGVLWYTSAHQVAVIAPYYLYWKDSTTIRIEYNGILSNTVTVPMQAAEPALFTADSSGKGQGAILNQDYSINSAGNPAVRGSIVILYLTGEGQTNPAGTDGLLATTGLPEPRLPVSVVIGGIVAEVLYAGAAPGFVAGSMQVNARIPANAPSGTSIPVQVSIGSANSPAGVTLAAN